MKHLLIAFGLVTGSLAHAQPAPPQPAPPSGDKADAKSLLQSGLKLFEAKDYLGALAVFRDAYSRFPSARILINIGTTLKELGRDAEAANAYQAYLDSPEAEPAKATQLEGIIAEIDKTVGKLEIAVTPADADVQVNSDEWTPAAKAKRYRVPPGAFTVNARKDKFQSEAKQTQINPGEIATITLTLAALPEPKQVVHIPIRHDPDGVLRDVSDTRARIGVLAIAHIDVPFDDRPRGGAALLGATADLTEQLRAQAALIIGPTAETDVTVSGVFAGASFAFLSGNLRPIASAGFPIFFSNGARFAVRGAGGVEWQMNKHVSLIAELGLEYVFNPEPMYKTNVFVPAIGAAGRL